MSKKCTKCEEIKELSCFYKHKRGKEGRTSKCKECTKKEAAAYREANILKIREYDRRRSGLPHRRKQSNEYMVRLKATNPDKIKEYHAKYKRNNPVKKQLNVF